ncbi:MAG: hypothetical protein M3N32_02075 [Actinomycetota bacterium]|nr:hypothetical protein [Actinomycetota bacterium]
MQHDVRDLETAAAMRLHERVWRLQRVAWIALALLVASALAGLFGPGPVSYRTARSEDGQLAVAYQRRGATSEVEVTVRQPPPGDVNLAVARDYLSKVNVSSIMPRPDEVRTEPGQVVFVFPVQPNVSDFAVVFGVASDTIGSMSATVAFDGAASHFRQFSYP